MTFAAFLLPAGNVMPILSSFSLSILPPFLDLALEKVEQQLTLGERSERRPISEVNEHVDQQDCSPWVH